MDVDGSVRQRTAGTPTDPACPSGEAPGSRSSAGLVDEFTDLFRTLKRIAALELARLRVRAERSGLVIARALMLASAAVTLGGALIVVFVFGLVGGLSALTGWPLWLSALVLGIAGPMAGLLLIQVALARRERARLAQLAEGSLEARAAKRLAAEQQAAEKLAAERTAAQKVASQKVASQRLATERQATA